MKFFNFFEKLGILLDLITNSNIFIILMLVIIAILLLRLTNIINNKKMGILVYFTEVIILGFIVYEGRRILFSTIEQFINNIFLNFYFPSVYVYMFIYILSLVIFIYSLLNRFISSVYKKITNTYFLIFHIIFIMLLDVIAKNNINVFAKESIFANNNSLILLELSTLLFFVYLITIFLVYFTNSLILIVEEKRNNKEVVYSEELELINPNTIEIDYSNTNVETVNPQVSFQELVKNIENINEEVFAKIDLVPEVKTIINNDILTIEDKEYKFIDPLLLEDSFSSNIKSNEEENLSEKLNFIDFSILESKEEAELTLSDYKLFSSMLKTVIQNNDNQKMAIEDILNRELLDKYSFEEYSKFEKILDSCLN